MVTGASGFVGRHLVRRLCAAGQPVRALYHRHPPSGELAHLPGVTWQAADLLDIFSVEEVVTGISEIYHCAAIVSFDPGERERLLHANVESTANVVNAALDAGVDKLVHVSSVASLGRGGTDRKKVITEETEWEESQRNSAYGISKYLSEMEVWRGIGEGLNAAVINPGIILGEGNWAEGSAHLMEIVWEEFPFYTLGVNAWVDVQDVVTIMRELMASETSAERFIVSTGNYSYLDVFTQMAQALNKKPPHIQATPLMTALVWRYSLLKSRLKNAAPTITRETARNAQAQCYYDNGKLLQALPDFKYTPLGTTIQRMAQAFLKDHQLHV